MGEGEGVRGCVGEGGGQRGVLEREEVKIVCG